MNKEFRLLPYLFSVLMIFATQTGHCSPEPENLPDQGGISLNLDNQDIRKLITIISKHTGRNFVIDPRIRGRVTLFTGDNLSPDEAYDIFLSVLDMKGYTVVPTGEAFKVIRKRQALTADLPIESQPSSSESSQMTTAIIRLQHASAANVATLIAPLLPRRESSLRTYAPTNTLIITDTSANIARIKKILAAIDVPNAALKNLVLPLHHAQAVTVAPLLQQIMANQKLSARTKRYLRRRKIITKSETAIIAYEPSNAIVVAGTKHDIKQARHYLKKLDIPVAKGSRKLKITYLQHAQAEPTAAIINQLPLRSSSAKNRKNYAVTADSETNALIIYGDRESCNEIAAVIKKLDIPRKQVFVNAVIMEVSRNSDLELGVQWNAFEDAVYDSGRKTGAVFARNSANFTTGLSDLSSGPLMGVIGDIITMGRGENVLTFPNAAAFINAMAGDDAVSIVSTPHLTTLDNREAEIKVGANIPYVTREDTDSTDINRTVRTYDYRDVGVNLKITPQINHNNEVILDIFQEISTLVPGQGEDRLAPSTLKRSAVTTVSIADRQTLVIGGLSGKSMTAGENRVPFLGRIKGLGWLFRNRSRADEKTDLYIFITPTVIDTWIKADKLYRMKYGEAMENTEAANE